MKAITFAGKIYAAAGATAFIYDAAGEWKQLEEPDANLRKG